MERRLAAILSLDVVGYSRLIGADEAGTLTMLHTFRKGLVTPTPSYENRLKDAATHRILRQIAWVGECGMCHERGQGRRHCGGSVRALR